MGTVPHPPQREHLIEKISLNGTALAYAEQGAGPAALFIHGTGTYSETFEPVLEQRSEDVRAITYDRRGFAGSAGNRASLQTTLRTPRR